MKRYKIAYIANKGNGTGFIEVWGKSKSDALDEGYGIVRAILGGKTNPYDIWVYSVIYSNGAEKILQTLPDRM